jgi:hypothetical protein
MMARHVIDFENDEPYITRPFIDVLASLSQHMQLSGKAEYTISGRIEMDGHIVGAWNFTAVSVTAAPVEAAHSPFPTSPERN